MTFGYPTASAYSTTTAAVADDKRMMNSWVGITSFTVSNLPTSITAGGYDLYVYFDWHQTASTATVSVQVGSTTVWGKDSTTNFASTANPSFVEATGTSSGTANTSNYFHFAGLSGNSVAATITGSPTKPITGFQIVAVPEPTALAGLGIGSMLMLGRPRGRRAAV